jgi:hypothetical protein
MMQKTIGEAATLEIAKYREGKYQCAPATLMGPHTIWNPSAQHHRSAESVDFVEFLFVFERQSFGSLAFLLRVLKEPTPNLYRQFEPVRQRLHLSNRNASHGSSIFTQATKRKLQSNK